MFRLGLTALAPLVFCAALAGTLCAEPELEDQPAQEQGEDVKFDAQRLRPLEGWISVHASTSGVVPPLYPWMLRRDLSRANWLGLPYKGKTLYEPINVVICDSGASSAEDAESRLMAACKKAGFLDRYGHSSDYFAFVDGDLARPFPPRKRHSLADKPFDKSNNHGRIFGPVHYRGKYCFAAAFSREKVRLEPPGHGYVSFNQARDAFSWALDSGGKYLVSGFAELGNAIIRSTEASTGDHDGLAVLLEAAE